MLSIKKYNKSMREEWDLFIIKSNNGTIFNTRKFLNYHINRKFKDYSLCFYNNKNLICVFPATINKADQKIISHPGASYGGLIIDTEIKFSTMNEIINLLINYCKKNNINSIFLINSPAIYWSDYDASLEYILEFNKFYSKEIYISHASQLNQKKPIIDYLDKRKRRYIKKFINNTEFKIIEHSSFADNYGKKFYNILNLNKQKYSTVPTHSIDELIKLKTIFPKQIKLFISLKNNCVVGGAVLFITNNNTSLVFYNAVEESIRQSQLAAYQLYYCANISEEKGMKFIDFGVSQEPENNNPLTPKISLIGFKEQFNSLGVWRRAYQKDFDV